MKAYSINLDQNFFRSYKFNRNNYEFLERNEDEIRENLSTLISQGENLKAADIENSWFPSTQIDIFISHSHRDRDIAISFAKWLYDSFELVSFVDSAIWGHAAKLKRKIDDTYSIKNRNTNNTYDYEKSRNSTTHVNMILSGALLKMINHSEAVFFINTPNSINSPKDSVDIGTFSPWIYLELLFTHYMIDREKKALDESTMFHDSEPKLKISFDINTEHLIPLNKKLIENWKIMHIVNKKNNIQKPPLKILDFLT